MKLAPNPRYSAGSWSSRRLILKISYASAKNCKGDAQGNIKEWGHKQIKKDK